MAEEVGANHIKEFKIENGLRPAVLTKFKSHSRQAKRAIY
jgi:hypothetical protein